MRIGIIRALLVIIIITMALTLFLANFVHRSEAQPVGSASHSLTAPAQ